MPVRRNTEQQLVGSWEFTGNDVCCTKRRVPCMTVTFTSAWRITDIATSSTGRSSCLSKIDLKVPKSALYVLRMPPWVATAPNAINPTSQYRKACSSVSTYLQFSIDIGYTQHPHESRRFQPDVFCWQSSFEPIDDQISIQNSSASFSCAQYIDVTHALRPPFTSPDSEITKSSKVASAVGQDCAAHTRQRCAQEYQFIFVPSPIRFGVALFEQ